MADVKIQGATYYDVPSLQLPLETGGMASFIGKDNVLKMGILRPDAELICSYNYDKYINADEEVTIPAYTTTAQTLKASESLETTISLSYSGYNYYEIVRMLAIPSYSVTTKGKGRIEYWFSTIMYEVSDVDGSTYKALISPTTKYTGRNVAITSSGALNKLIYWTSGTAIGVYATASYGVYMTPTVPSIASSVMTIKTPALMERGSTTYFTTTYMGAVTDIRYQYVIDVYRAPKSNLAYDGWGLNQNTASIIYDVYHNNQKLR